MERKIGETFEFEGKKLQVKESEEGSCNFCFFNSEFKNRNLHVSGACDGAWREDGKNVIFVEVQEQPQPQKLNLCEVLKYCPEGEPFWSPMLGDVKLYDIIQSDVVVRVSKENGETWVINADGTITIGEVTSPEIMLYPSREQRDWAKVKYEKKKERFDPKTLKPFDKVLVRVFGHHIWKVDFYSHKGQGKEFPYICVGNTYKYCIPYNDDTKHLVGTKDEAPDFYKYWED